MSTEQQKQYARDWHRRKRERIRQSLADLPARLHVSARHKAALRQRRVERSLAGQPVRQWITERVA